ncbi:MAG TPA: pyridoxal phosphate-dependent aminotransferase [Chloroflexia bacterium]|nr:pyridoxal phosphate-dependent aminotransferase [Chloroflexia bacterium]
MSEAVAAKPANTLRLSQRCMSVSPSASMSIEARIAEMRAAGEPVISFGVGEPDFPTPEIIKEAGHEAINNNQTKYTPAGGTIPLRKAIAAQLKQDTGLDYAYTQVTVTNGAKEALYLAFQALCDKGDEVIVPAPYWVSYLEQVKLAEATPVVIETTSEAGFKVTPAQLEAATTPKTRMLVLNSPSNPTGMVYTRAELEGIANWARSNNVLIMTDEIYDRVLYVEDYARLLRVAPDLVDRTIVINGLSKTYSMTGWRVGYAAGPEAAIKAMIKIQGHSTSHPSSVSQYAALKAYNTDLNDEIARMVAAFKERRDWIVAALNEIPGVRCLTPEGAFYVFPDFTGVLGRELRGGKVCNTTAELASYILDEVKVGIIHGEAFGTPGCARLSYALSLDKIKEGIGRIKEALS